MPEQIWIAIIGAVGIVTAPILGYLAAVRKLSGQIETSSADELWDEARDIRQDYQRRLAEADGKYQVLEQKWLDCSSQNNQLREENLELRREINNVRDEMIELRRTISESNR